MNLPNLVLIGVNKAGTTSLFSYLSAHPDVCFSSKKETGFFDPVRYGTGPAPAAERYAEYFKHCSGQTRFRLEGTANYYYGGRRMAEAMREMLGEELRVAVILREPVSRVVSNFKFQKTRLQLDESVSFKEYIDRCVSFSKEEIERQENNVYYVVEGGKYDLWIEDWIETFGERFRLLFFDALKEDPRGELRRFCEWCGLDAEPFEDLDLSAQNQTYGYRNAVLHGAMLQLNMRLEKFFRSRPQLKKAAVSVYRRLNGKPAEAEIPDSERERLRQLYRPHNARLAQVLRRHGRAERLPAWLAEVSAEQAQENGVK